MSLSIARHTVCSAIPLLIGTLSASAFAQPEPEVAPAEVTLEEEPETDEPALAPSPSPVPTPNAEPPAPPGAVAAGEESSSSKAVVLGGSSGPASPASGGGIDVGPGGWEFSYHGYFRAPFRLGVAKRVDSQRTGAPLYQDLDGDGTAEVVGITAPRGSDPSSFNPTEAYKQQTYHAPLIPDDQYLSWQHTRHNQPDWAELFFSVGNPVASGTVSIEGFNFTQAAFTDYESQFGIAQGWVEIKPELGLNDFQLAMKAGAHWGKYGLAGRYDAGEYDTYLFGRTKVMGLTVTEKLYLGDVALWFEEGFGGHRPHPSQLNTAKFTLLAHAHAGLRMGGLEVGLHALHSWAQEEDRDGQGCPGPAGVDDNTGRPTNNGTCAQLWGGGAAGSAGTDFAVGGVAGYGKFADGAEANVWLPDGHMTVLGPEVRFDTGHYGLVYLGWSHINAKNALTVGPAIEVVHSNGGGEFSNGVTNNYLDNPRCKAAKGECSSGGTGKVDTLLFQYELSLHNLLNGTRGEPLFWGDGWDVTTKLYAMYNHVKSDYALERDGSLGAFEMYGGVGAGAPSDSLLARPNYWVAQGEDFYSEHSKLKFGTDIFANLLPILGAGLRVDHVRPNSNLPKQAFSILSPRVEFRSRWVTRERIAIQYSRYIYAQRLCPELQPFNAGERIGSDSAERFDYTGSPENFTGMPASPNCVQRPSGARLPDGWGAVAEETQTEWRGAPITGGNPNNTRPDENVIKIEASMWW